MQDFRKLKVWQKAHQLVLVVYKTTRAFPPDERYGLTAQMRRASSSIPTNLAEASGRTGDKDRARFFQIAVSSACELEYQFILSRDLEYLDSRQYDALWEALEEIKRMLTGLLKRIRLTRRHSDG